MPQASERAPSPHCDIMFDTCCGIFECATAGCNKWADTIDELPCPMLDLPAKENDE